MKIFPKNTENRPVKTNKAPNKTPSDSRSPAKATKKQAPIKKEMSDSEIKEKLAANVQTSDVAKNLAIAKTKKMGETFLNESIKPEMIKVEAPILAETLDTPNTKDFVLKSDIAANDPKDTNTQEKLKSIISKGAFSFNPKEREALEKILAG